jgi:hypothetical protein
MLLNIVGSDKFQLLDDVGSHQRNPIGSNSWKSSEIKGYQWFPTVGYCRISQGSDRILVGEFDLERFCCGFLSTGSTFYNRPKRILYLK